MEGTAGTGKSVIAAKVMERLGDSVVAFHFCRHDDAAQSEPSTLLKSLAAMLCQRLKGFSEALRAASADEALASGKIGQIFEGLLGLPLQRMAAPSKTVIIIIDALDELPRDTRQQVVSLLVLRLHTLPEWVRFFITVCSI